METETLSNNYELNDVESTSFMDNITHTENGMVLPIINDNDSKFDLSILLEEYIVEFVSQVILQHEKFLFHLIPQHYPDIVPEILGTTNNTILRLISTLTDTFYNNLYMDIQNDKKTPTCNTINQITKLVSYGPHILLTKLYYLTINIHTEITREELIFDETIDKYCNSLERHINFGLMTTSIKQMFANKLQYLSIPFKHFDSSSVPFNSQLKK